MLRKLSMTPRTEKEHRKIPSLKSEINNLKCCR
jgi:hypothetical protein